MGELATITHEDSKITLSMVKWSALRRTALSLMPKKARLFGGAPCRFTPKYEVAIFDGSPKVVFSKQPTFVFYYPDKETAFEKWDELLVTIKHGGLYSLREFILNGRPEKQGVLTNLPSLQE